jgi:chromosome segregation ATPase
MILPVSLAAAIKKARDTVDLLENSLARLSDRSEHLAELRLAFLDDKETLWSHVAQIDEADTATREQITENCELIVSRLEAHCVQLAELERFQRDMLSRLSSTPAASAVLSSAGEVTVRRDALRRVLLRMEAGPAGTYLRTKVR